MPSARDVVIALYGAWHLMRFDAAGMGWFELSLPAFWRSFFAAALVAPAFAVVVALELGARPEAIDVGWAIVVSIVAYVVGWAAFPVAAIFLTRLLGLAHRYFPLIIAYNWASVPQMAVLVPAILIDASGLVPQAVGPILTMAATIYVLLYQWFVTRVALETSGLTAAGVVVFEVVLGEFIHSGANSLI